MGCELGQGYLFSRPLDADAMLALLTEGRCLLVRGQVALQPGASAATAHASA
jgi:hypothetical protein